MKLIKQFLLATFVLLLASSCLKDKTYDFKPIGNAYLDLSEDSITNQVFCQLITTAKDYNYGQLIAPATVTIPSYYGGMLQEMTCTNNNAYYIGPVVSYSTEYDGLYTFTLTNYYDKREATSTDMLYIPPIETPIVHLDSVVYTPANANLDVAWTPIAESSYYSIELFNVAGDTIFGSQFVSNNGTVNPDNFSLSMYGLETNRDYQLKITSVVMKDGSDYLKAYTTSSSKTFTCE